VEAEQNDSRVFLLGRGPGLAELADDFGIRRCVAVERALKIVTDDFSVVLGEVGVSRSFVPGAAETDHGCSMMARSEDVFDFPDAPDVDGWHRFYLAGQWG
jgi:hypothetical protein